MAYETFRVLLADDDPVIRLLYDKVLRDHHYQVTLAVDGEEALYGAFQEPPDIVLLDIMMPKMDGYEVCARLRAAPATADIPIMILTALSGTAARQKAQELGADDFVTKGSPLEGVEGRIKMLLKRRVLAHTRSWLAGLPGSVAAEHALQHRLREGRPVAMCYLDVDGLDAFNHLLGFDHGDRILWKVARTLTLAVRQENEGDFVGYCGDGRFMLITAPNRAERLVQSVLRSYEEGSYDGSTTPSLGTKAPTISVGVVLAEGGRALHPGQVSELGRSLLRQAKDEPGNAVRVGKL